MSQDLNYEEQNGTKRVDEIEMDPYKQSEEVVVEKKFKPPSESKSISWRWPILFVGFCCLLYYMIHLNDHILPDVISEEEAVSNFVFLLFVYDTNIICFRLRIRNYSVVKDRGQA